MEENRFKNDFIPSSWVDSDKTIKVIGVGGGGCNAVNYMSEQKIEGCSFIVCNTDSQALSQSPIPTKIQLGEGLGAGTDPTKARNAATEAKDILEKEVINEETKMLFITAGLGGGTGTGASPVIAQMAKEAKILTVAVITLPFKAEGPEAHNKAIDCIQELQQNVDSMIIINNDKLYEHFKDLTCKEAYSKTDEILSTAVKGIVEIIKKPGQINVDFQDVKTTMENSKMALMGCGEGEGENKLEDAINQAFDSPLLNDLDLKTAKKILVNVTVAKNTKMSDLNNLDQLIEERTGNLNKFKRGIIFDDSEEFEGRIHITLVATGFEYTQLGNITEIGEGNSIHISEDFTHEKFEAENRSEEISLGPPNINISKVGFNTKDNCRKFSFSKKPTLVVEPTEDISDLENTPAIRRMKITTKE